MFGCSHCKYYWHGCAADGSNLLEQRTARGSGRHICRNGGRDQAVFFELRDGGQGDFFGHGRRENRLHGCGDLRYGYFPDAGLERCGGARIQGINALGVLIEDGGGPIGKLLDNEIRYIGSLKLKVRICH